jgi:FO synthase subunit 2
MEMDIETEISERVVSGEASFKDAIHLLQNPLELFLLADKLRRLSNGNEVTYVVNRNINFTNKCINDCRFCAFRERNGNGYLLSRDEILKKAGEAVRFGATEICIQGGLIDGWEVENYCELIDRIKKRYPFLHIHAFSPMEIFHMSRNSGTSIPETLHRLKESGLDSIPGTAAEILVERVRKMICPSKISSKEWIYIIRSAHESGIPTTATMMYGHVESEEERIIHILKIRELQKMTGGIVEFIPLPFLPGNNPLGEVCRGPSFFKSMKVHALARILLHPFIKNIQASWVKLGPEGAKRMLFFGANDLGGTLMEENISRSAGSPHGEIMTPGRFDFLIRSAGRKPVRRTTLYEVYQR